jgi:hypothetical protein
VAAVIQSASPAAHKTPSRPISHNGPERQLVSDIFTFTDGIGSALGFYARTDPRLHVCDDIKSFIFRVFV